MADEERDPSVRRLRLRVEGVVQGVGFRPFVHRAATELGLGGLVGNDAAGVFIEVEGAPADLDRFRASAGEGCPAAGGDRPDRDGVPRARPGAGSSPSSRATRAGSIRR